MKWLKVEVHEASEFSYSPDYTPLDSIFIGVGLGKEWRYWLRRRETEGFTCGVKLDNEQVSSAMDI